MTVQEFRVKKVVTTKGELVRMNEWEAFLMFYKLDDMKDCSDDEKFVLDPGDAVIFNLLPQNEAMKLDEFYQNQLQD